MPMPAHAPLLPGAGATPPRPRPSPKRAAAPSPRSAAAKSIAASEPGALRRAARSPTLSRCRPQCPPPPHIHPEPNYLPQALSSALGSGTAALPRSQVRACSTIVKVDGLSSACLCTHTHPAVSSPQAAPVALAGGTPMGPDASFGAWATRQQSKTPGSRLQSASGPGQVASTTKPPLPAVSGACAVAAMYSG